MPFCVQPWAFFHLFSSSAPFTSFSSSSEISSAAAVFFFLSCAAFLPPSSCGLAELPCTPPSSYSFLVYSMLMWCKTPCFLLCFPTKLCPVLYPKSMLCFYS
ncbi:hypothetical protein I3843_15G120500 [Carya illinoinensis]|nr:hypothetical protein I3843_15G120500 [Carya illinoinensis]